MEKTESEVLEIIRKLKNKKAKEWRDKNKDKVRAINQRYWLKKAKQLLEEGEK